MAKVDFLNGDHHLAVIEIQICCCVPNFIKIRWNMAISRFSRWRMGSLPTWILWVQIQLWVLWKAHVSSYRSSIEIIALSCSVFFIENRVFVYVIWRQTTRRTNRRTTSMRKGASRGKHFFSVFELLFIKKPDRLHSVFLRNIWCFNQGGQPPRL